MGMLEKASAEQFTGFELHAPRTSITDKELPTLYKKDGTVQETVLTHEFKVFQPAEDV